MKDKVFYLNNENDHLELKVIQCHDRQPMMIIHSSIDAGEIKLYYSISIEKLYELGKMLIIAVDECKDLNRIGI